MPRAVVDINVWVSAVLNPRGFPAKVLDAFVTGRLVAVTSAPLLGELEEVLTRPRFVRRYRVAPDDVAELLGLFRAHSAIVTVPGILRLCRDPDDDRVIETAVVGNADALVARDYDLNSATEVIEALTELGIPVLSVDRFLDRLDATPPSLAEA